MRNHLDAAWRMARVASSSARFAHFFLPEDPDEAHLALMHLSRTTPILRHEGAEGGGSYEQARLHDLVTNEGFSHHPVHGSAPSHGFMASYDAHDDPDVAQVHHISAISPDHIAGHRSAISHHLGNPSSYQGGWHDTSTGDVYLDASRHFDHKSPALDFAAHQKQKAIFDLGDFSEHFLHPHQDPLAQKDMGAWHERYGDDPKPHPRFHEYADRYPFTDDQKHFWGQQGHHLAKKHTAMAGRPIGAFRGNPDIQRRLARYQDR